MKTVVKIFFLMLFILSACHIKRQETENPGLNQEEALLRANKYLVKKDADEIKGYIRRHNLNMTQTKSGLWYEIIEKGTGTKAETGETAEIGYKVLLLDGTLCYSSEKSGTKKFNIGKGGVEPGLEQGILLMHEGDKARFIMPPHLAYGLMGDENKIPARSTIIYEVHLLKLVDQQ